MSDIITLSADPRQVSLVPSKPRVVGCLGPLVTIEPDPLGPVNRIVRINRVRDGRLMSVRGALIRVEAGTEVSFYRCALPTREVATNTRGDVWQQSWPDAEWGWAVDVDGSTVLWATDSEIWPNG